MFDVVVVGAGFAGASAAYFLGRAGVKTLVVDLKHWSRVGDRPCGDAVSKHYFDELSLPYPRGEELEGTVKAIAVYSPSESSSVVVRGEGFEVNGVRYVQRLLGEALGRGCEFLGGAHVRGPMVKDGRVVGVRVWAGGLREIHSRVVVDASGNARAVTRHLPPSWPINEPLDPGDANVAYREVRVLANGVEDPEVLRIYVNAEVAPGGYWWLFPYSAMEGYVNVGLGVRADLRGLHPRELLYKHVLSRPWFRGSRVVAAGGALIPTRRPVPSLVWDGVAVVGDAAYVVNPVHGGGKGPSMVSAKCVADAVVDALSAGDASSSGLWGANICYMRRYGYKQGALDVFRYFLQRLGNDDLEFSISRGLVSGEELNEVSSRGRFEVGMVDRIARLAALLTRPTLLIRLRSVVRYAEAVREHYMNYPQKPEGLSAWVERLEGLVRAYRSMLQ